MKNRILDYVQVKEVAAEQKKVLAYLYMLCMIPMSGMTSSNEMSGYVQKL